MRAHRQFEARTCVPISVIETGRSLVFTRQEEGLLSIDNNLIDKLQVAEGSNPMTLLRDYTFNPGDESGEPRRYFPNVSSCPVYMAVANLLRAAGLDLQILTVAVGLAVLTECLPGAVIHSRKSEKQCVLLNSRLDRFGHSRLAIIARCASKSALLVGVVAPASCMSIVQT